MNYILMCDGMLMIFYVYRDGEGSSQDEAETVLDFYYDHVCCLCKDSLWGYGRD